MPYPVDKFYGVYTIRDALYIHGYGFNTKSELTKSRILTPSYDPTRVKMPWSREECPIHPYIYIYDAMPFTATRGQEVGRNVCVG